MPPLIYLAPAAGGKTAVLVDMARQLAQNPAQAPRVIVPTRLQVRAWRERLAHGGGAMGVQIGTFDDIYRDVLRAARSTVTRLGDPVQVRLLRMVISGTPLTYYAPIQRTSGFAQAVRDMIDEMKAGGIFPERLREAIEAMGTPPRLMELAQLYEAYQEHLQEKAWADAAGIGWLAAEALRQQPSIASGWPVLMVDGFDDLTSVQIQVLAALAPQVRQMIVTLTGTADGTSRPLVHKRLIRTRERLEDALAVKAQSLPATVVPINTARPLKHLGQTLYTDQHITCPAGNAVRMVAVTDREAEVRAALRWIKSCIVRQGMRPDETALLARDISPYRDFIVQIAAEYRLPVRIASGHALRSNPAVAALLTLLQLAAPGDTHLAWRSTVATWRSPYFNWELAHAAPGDTDPIGITPQDAEPLAWIAQWGSVISGWNQWHETFELLSQACHAGESRDEDTPDAPDTVPVGEQAETLARKFTRFCNRIAPPEGEHSYRHFVAWLEDLIGDTDEMNGEEPTTSLGIAYRAGTGRPAFAERDLAALNALKDVLRGLVWAEAAIDGPLVTYEIFLDELLGALDAATYRIPLPSKAEVVLAADVIQTRGISYRAVAIMGLAEGEFPATLSEDPFLRNRDRRQLREDFGLPIDRSPDSLEGQYFYAAITRPREALLLTRPRIADNGAPWQPSPFWEEVRRRIEITPQLTGSRSYPTLSEAASWPELLESAAATHSKDTTWDWIQTQQPALDRQIDHGQEVLSQRSEQAQGAFDGDLSHWPATFTELFAPSRPWSASRLESYRRCPFSFFVSSVLNLEPRHPPSEGLDARQIGNIYHHILETLYRTVGVGASPTELVDTLPTVAEPILDAAPRVEQFRKTAWWDQTRQQILDNVRQSVEAIESLSDGFAFHEAERTFGIPEREGDRLCIRDEKGDSFQVRGFIDRVDRDTAGHVRIVDYKTGGPAAYTNAAAVRGEKLQLALYALAARDALDLGQVTEGFYWHVRHAQASSFKLSRFRTQDRHGPQAAMETAVEMAWEAVHGARRGYFIPTTPHGGCPSYCPAASFCWHYQPQRWG